jgi:hypothetical protein
MDIQPREADVIGVVKSGRIQLARLKGLHEGIVAHGRSSEVEFRGNLFPSLDLGGERKRPRSEDRGHFLKYTTAFGRSVKQNARQGKCRRADI